MAVVLRIRRAQGDGGAARQAVWQEQEFRQKMVVVLSRLVVIKVVRSS